MGVSSITELRGSCSAMVLVLLWWALDGLVGDQVGGRAYVEFGLQENGVLFIPRQGRVRQEGVGRHGSWQLAASPFDIPASIAAGTGVRAAKREPKTYKSYGHT